ncbi:TIGR03032 family protein [[Limnothrix rosea] IAM M-220]|uniref:TIGR03032 family protein n=1 Tax=[Limnothrix rosea] IAM M-220 TaxID=454133 RepID=UPI00095B98BA|nr:TIGR03032 family protein [[Limnothrix rosea] IAM M-220]OKH17065.1 TIGR03032 family protein [[Limnothrix rosea] IAM M-220]
MKIKSSGSFLEILQKTNMSLLVSTYQAGKLMFFRNQGNTLNSHFRTFRKAMGVAANKTRLAVGTLNHIKEFYNMPAIAPKLEGGKHDACYLLRNTHVTGNIDIHEMDWAGDELWFVNTKFSCLCTLDDEHSFVPRWRPHFITGYAPEDRCHLNGLAIVDDKPKYVTSLGVGDTLQAWRENKRDGGVIMDVENNEFVIRGLSMPHSPRWYRGKLWVLESGRGSLATVDLDTGKLETVAQVPGFTRGIDFYRNLAFIGLSKLRCKSESDRAIFSDIPLTDEFDERTCGVWVVDIERGETVANVIFEDLIEEIFAVKVLAGAKYPEIVDIIEPQLSSHLGTSFALEDNALAQVPTTIKL